MASQIRNLSLLLLPSILLSCLCTATVLETGRLTREALISADTSAVCNDGTSPVYYKRLNTTSSVWLIYLEGGGFCFDEESCEERFEDLTYDVTGSFEVVPKSLILHGILSNDCTVNPHFCAANIFYLHYCSSDMWLGEQEIIGQSMQHFQGKRIFEQIINQIFSLYPTMATGTEIVLSGAATGAVGILGLADWLKAKLESEMALSIYQYYAIADSGWLMMGSSFVDYTCGPCQCNTQEAIIKAYEYQNLQFDQSCEYLYAQNWKCAFFQEYYVAYEISTPIFSTFFLEDSTQMWSDGVNKTSAKNFDTDELEWAKKRANETIRDVETIESHVTRHGFYIIDCLHHVVTTQDEQISLLEVDKMSLNGALEQWLEGLQTSIIESDCGTTIGCNPECIANLDPAIS